MRREEGTEGGKQESRERGKKNSFKRSRKHSLSKTHPKSKAQVCVPDRSVACGVFTVPLIVTRRPVTLIIFPAGTPHPIPLWFQAPAGSSTAALKSCSSWFGCLRVQHAAEPRQMDEPLDQQLRGRAGPGPSGAGAGVGDAL